MKEHDVNGCARVVGRVQRSASYLDDIIIVSNMKHPPVIVIITTQNDLLPVRARSSSEYDWLRLRPIDLCDVRGAVQYPRDIHSRI